MRPIAQLNVEDGRNSQLQMSNANPLKEKATLNIVISKHEADANLTAEKLRTQTRDINVARAAENVEADRLAEERTETEKVRQELKRYQNLRATRIARP